MGTLLRITIHIPILVEGRDGVSKRMISTCVAFSNRQLSGPRGSSNGKKSRGYLKFLDWEEFQKKFQKDFCPAHSDVTAINTTHSAIIFLRTRPYQFIISTETQT